MVPLYRDSVEFYTLLGSAFLKLNEHATAITYLNRAHQLEPQDVGISIFLIAALVARGDEAAAAGLCLGILDREPENAVALRVMDIMRTQRKTGTGSESCGRDASARIVALLPSAGYARTRVSRIVIPAVLILLACALIAGATLISRGRSTEYRHTISPNEIALSDAVVSGPRPGEVEAAPGKFAGAKIRWRGFIANAARSGDGGRFLLVAGNRDMSRVEALVSVISAAKIPTAGSFVEVEGLIAILDRCYEVNALRIVTIAGKDR